MRSQILISGAIFTNLSILEMEGTSIKTIKAE